MTNQSERDELLRARTDLQRQIEVVSHPMMGRDRNPQLLTKLQAMLDEVNALLAQEDSSGA
jgi:hypothetical protein